MTLQEGGAVVGATLMTVSALGAFGCTIWMADMGGSKHYARSFGIASVMLWLGFSAGAIAGGSMAGALPPELQLWLVVSSLMALGFGFVAFAMSYNSYYSNNSNSPGIIGDI